MARRKRRSTRKGQIRKSSRRAYTKTRRRRTFGSRRGRITNYPRRQTKTGLVKARTMGALKECSWITAGSATGLAAQRWMPQGALGLQSPTLVGLGALGYGVWRNDPKGIYLGFGALYPAIYTQLQKFILPQTTTG